jgi:thiamine pyrophosphokinase
VPGPPLTAIIFSGGDPPGPEAITDLPADRFVIAADSGLDHARRLGVAVDVVVGDLDSVDPTALAEAEANGVTVERHPRDKDQTDGALALVKARERGATRVIVIGGFGGRIDHLLANVAMWAAPAWASLQIEIRSGQARLVVVHGPGSCAFDGAPGALVTLLAVEGPVTGITTSGLRFALQGGRLEPGSTRGVSNEQCDPYASVAIDSGTLLVIRPGPEGGG